MDSRTGNKNCGKQLTAAALMACLLLGLFLFGGLSQRATAQGVDSTPATDIERQFNNLKDHGEALGWMLPENQGAPDPTMTNHYQGLVRYPGPGTPVFYVTQKYGGGGYLNVVVFSTRPTDGERMRSNLLKKGTITRYTVPDSSDTWAVTMRFDGSFKVDDAFLPAYIHPGSMAIADDILFVPLDTSVAENNSGTDVPSGHVVLFDISDDIGTYRSNVVQPQGTGNPIAFTPIQAIHFNHDMDNIAVIKQDDGTYLVWINGDGGDVTKLYKTNGTDLRADDLEFVLVQNWNKNSAADYDGNGESWPGGTGAHQSSTFLRANDGTLFLLGMRHPGGAAFMGSDYADLYRVQFKTGGGFKLIRVNTRHFYCDWDEVGRICNFSAATNAYVSPSGQLILYSIPHDDEDSAASDYAKLAEFRFRDVNKAGECGTYPWAWWAELYDDVGFSDRSIVFDWDDRNKDDFDHFSYLDYFDNKASSARWCVPKGCSITLYEDDTYRGSNYTLQGNGTVLYANNLKDLFGFKVSSIAFSSGCTNPNTRPAVDAGADITIPESSKISRSGSFTDPNSSDQWTATVNYGDGSGTQSLALAGKTFSLYHQYVLQGIYQVEVVVTDSQGASGSDSFTVDTNNEPPQVTSFTMQAHKNVTLDFTSANFASSFCDPGSDPMEKIKIVALPENGVLFLQDTPVFTGQEITVHAINDLAFMPDADWTGLADLSWNGYDGESYATLDAQAGMTFSEGSDNNDAPVNTVPMTQTVYEDSSLDLTFGISDLDAGDADDFQFTLSADHGTLNVQGSTAFPLDPPTLSLISGSNGSGEMTFAGSLYDINRSLWSVVYTPNLGYSGPDTITLVANDNGNTGDGGALTDTDTVDITVMSANDAPVNSVPGAQILNEETSTAFSLSVADEDAAGDSTFQVTLEADHGTLALPLWQPDLPNLSRLHGNDSNATYEGTLDNVNLVLANTVYYPQQDYDGPDVVRLISNDMGHSGFGGYLQDEDTITMTVAPVNDAPANIVPEVQTTTVSTPLIFSVANDNRIAICDVDAKDSPIQVSLASISGTLTMSNTTGLAFSSGDGAADEFMTFTGSLEDINAALNGLRFDSTAQYTSTATIEILVNDLGNTGPGAALSDRDTVTVTVLMFVNTGDNVYYMPLIFKS